MQNKTLANKYEIRHEIARGAFGVVYLAYHTALDRYTAIKALHAHYSEEPNFRKRFIREAKALAKLNHENIVAIYDILEEDGVYNIVMEYVEGDSLDQRIKKKEHLSIEEALDISIQIAQGLEYAHGFGIVHRDIKPQNILITEQDKVKLTDFGIVAAADEANLTQVGQVIGTPRYMSPEQAFGQEVDARSDIYSLGIVMHQMLSGKTPFDSFSSTQVLHELFSKEKEIDIDLPANTPQPLVDLIHIMLEKDKEKRIGSCALVINALTQLKTLYDGDKTAVQFSFDAIHKERPGSMAETVADTVIKGTETIADPAPATEQPVPTPPVIEQPVVHRSVKPTTAAPPPATSKPKGKSPIGLIAVATSLIAAAGIGFFVMNSDKTSVEPLEIADETPPAPTLPAVDTRLSLFRDFQSQLEAINQQINSLSGSITTLGPIDSTIKKYTKAKNTQQTNRQLKDEAQTAFINKDFDNALTQIRNALETGKSIKNKFSEIETELHDLYLARTNTAIDKLKQTKQKLSDAKKKAIRAKAETLAKNQWSKAVNSMGAAEDAEQNVMDARDARNYKIAISDITTANSEYLRAIKAFNSARAWAQKTQRKQQQIAKKEEKNNERIKQQTKTAQTKPSQKDYDTISQRLITFEKAYEARDIKTLKKLVSFTPQQEKFLQGLFGKFRTIEISITSLELTSDSAMVRITIDHLINDKMEATIPGDSWKTSQFIIRKKNSDWGKLSWM